MPKKPFLKKLFGRKRNSYGGGDAPSRPTLSILETIVGFPFRLLGSGLRTLGVFHDTGVTTDADRERKRGSIGSAVKYLLWLPIRIIRFPVTLLNAIWKASKKELLFGIPAIAVLAVLGFVVTQVFGKANEITNRYERGLHKAVTAGNLQLAKTYFSRLEVTTDLGPSQRLRWAKALAKMGAPKEAQTILGNLAPDDKPGFSFAHQTKAVSLAHEFEKTRNTDILPLLKWHLDHSPINSPKTAQAWAAYYVAMENPDRAAQALRKFAETQPFYYLAIANIYERKEKDAERELALNKAEVAYRSLLAEDELKHPIRITLAKVLYQLDKLDEARELLEQGIRIQPDESLKLTLSELYLQQFNKLQTSGQPSDEQLQLLMDAIAITPNFGPIYSRMIVLFMSGTQSPDSAKKIRNKFQSMLLESKPQPFAHFALSNIHWFEGNKDKSRFHMERAYELDRSLVAVVNNMAWMLAHESEPDLERALEMSSIAIEQSPADGRFQDTHGTVLLKMKRYRDAIEHLELALSFYQQNNEIHDKLAEAYSEIGMLEIAEMHRGQSAKFSAKKQ